MEITDIEIAIDRETDLWLEKKTPLECPNCGILTYRTICPFCMNDELLTGDPVVDDVLERRAHGEKASLNEYFKYDKATGRYSGKAFELEKA